MSAVFMFAIAALYIAAAGSFAFEGKIAWCVLALCWGIGNFILGGMSR